MLGRETSRPVQFFLIKGFDQVGQRIANRFFQLPQLLSCIFGGIRQVQEYDQLRQTGRIDCTLAMEILQGWIVRCPDFVKLPMVIALLFGVVNVVRNIRDLQLNQAHKDPVNSGTHRTNKVDNLIVAELGL